MMGMAVGATTRPDLVTARNCVIAFSALFMFGYNALVGGATYPTATEMIRTRLRSWTASSAISLGDLLAWLAGFCFLLYQPQRSGLGKSPPPGAHPSLCPRCLTFVLTGDQVRLHMGGIKSGRSRLLLLVRAQTKGKTLEEIDELFAKRVSVRGFQ